MRDLSCKFDLKRLLDDHRMPKLANKFFDVFIEDYDGKLYDVPIKIAQATTFNGQLLGRRFFLIDTLLGR